ncbi:DUF4437 domain-containing protein [Nitrogeniibacter mangrovi]|uniref:DUF4437 domain-containing protein n=1 Tax=Nitrogeniibacter mangrovi TaxID=2016596 RepID=A0A6C1B6C9_9RHOO|nr:cupin domain-containing protein [Nitrogeniibacter mangrovi]QID19282.1 DUF4437 domain-containing protein [Nitrogeniibacter mangrovi]
MNTPQGGERPLNMDFTRRVVIRTTELNWQPSPAAGVWRKPLAREFAEHGHATSVVRYDPGSHFKAHTHPLGEEILVLAGTFSDEHGDFGPGSYFRNPPGSRHAPFSEAGCTLFVKLHQFAADDTAQVCIDTTTGRWQAGADGIAVMPLHHHGTEQVALARWPAGTQPVAHRHAGGAEIFVLSGELIDAAGRYPAGTWLRLPPGSEHQPRVDQETMLWIKTGHLPHPA